MITLLEAVQCAYEKGPAASKVAGPGPKGQTKGRMLQCGTGANFKTQFDWNCSFKTKAPPLFSGRA